MKQEWRERAVPSAVPRLRREVAAFASELGVPDPPLADVRLAVTEAVTNVVIHSYRDAPSAGEIELVAAHNANELRIVVCDRGQGLTPRDDSPGLGLGLELIAKVADRWEIQRREPAGVELHMSFSLAG